MMKMMMFHVDPFSSTLHFNDNNNDGAQDYGGDIDDNDGAQNDVQEKGS